MLVDMMRISFSKLTPFHLPLFLSSLYIFLSNLFFFPSYCFSTHSRVGVWTNYKGLLKVRLGSALIENMIFESQHLKFFLTLMLRPPLYFFLYFLWCILPKTSYSPNKIVYLNILVFQF